METLCRRPPSPPLSEERDSEPTFDDLYAQVLATLQREGRVSYRALKRRFALDDELLTDLKSEIITAKQLARDEDGEVLVWAGKSQEHGAKSTEQRATHEKEEKSKTPSASLALRSLLPALQAGAERRHLTVMFCDLVGSTRLASQLDPEELREVIRTYQQTCADVVSRYDGYIAQYLGDGLLVYFGYPAAHEDDAGRAVRTGLDIVAAMQSSNIRETVLPRPLQVRVGIHVGVVVIGEVGEGESAQRLALGETPNLAARLQAIAAPDTVVISQETQRLIAGYFTCRHLGTHTLPGVVHPMEVYHVLSENPASSRVEVAPLLTPLAGRDHELGLLLNRWHQAKDRSGQGVLLSGEPGVGKSRLVYELGARVRAETHRSLEARCSSYHHNSAFYPVIDFLQRTLQFQRGESVEDKLLKLQEAVQRYQLPTSEAVPLLATLLSLPVPSEFSLEALSPQKQKERTMHLMLAWLLAEAERHPLLSVWEDIHWADPSTLEFLDLLLDRVPHTPLLVVLTFRPEFVAPWTNRLHLTALPVARLLHQQTIEIIQHLTGGKPLPEEVMHQIIAKTDGIPLFIEELTKMVMESGVVRETQSHYELIQPLSQLVIPATIHDSLMARLDRLASVGDVVQLGATIGREFSYELLRAVSPLEESVLRQELVRLVEAEVLYQRGQPPQATYLFKHALLQDAAYQSLLKRKRQQYHQHIATVLEAQLPEVKETQPELLAHHYTQAQLIAQAVPYWHRAGQRAIERSANQEAIGHLKQGIELLQTLPDTPERFQQELSLQTLLGAPMVMCKGYAAPEVEDTYARARELCQRAGETPQLFPALLGLWGFSLTRGELHAAREIGEQLLRVAQRTQDPTLHLGAHRAFGILTLHLGDLSLARTHLESGIALYDREQHRPNVFFYSVADPGVACLSFAAIALALLGYLDQARNRSQEAVTLARTLAHPFSSVLALNFASIVSELLREPQVGRTYAEEAIALSTEQGFTQQLAIGTIQRGGLLVANGQHEEGITLCRQGLALQRATGTELGRPYHLCLLAQGYAAVGRIPEGLECLGEGFAMVSKSAEYEPELYRLKGELLLPQKSREQGAGSKKSENPNPNSQSPNPSSEAEACFLKAIEVARRQQAKLLELRALMSLSRLWQDQGCGINAQQMLSECYQWFTEGLNNPDLREAQLLLEELGQ